MRYEPVPAGGVNVKLADCPGSSPRRGSGVLHSALIGCVALSFVTTAHEFGTVEWFKH